MTLPKKLVTLVRCLLKQCNKQAFTEKLNLPVYALQFLGRPPCLDRMFDLITYHGSVTDLVG